MAAYVSSSSRSAINPFCTLSTTSPLIITRESERSIRYRVHQGTYSQTVEQKDLLQLFNHLKENKDLHKQLLFADGSERLMTRDVRELKTAQDIVGFSKATVLSSKLVIAHVEHRIAYDYNVYLQHREDRLITDETDAEERLLKNFVKAQESQLKQGKHPRFVRAVRKLRKNPLSVGVTEPDFSVIEDHLGPYEYAIAVRKNTKKGGKKPLQDSHCVSTFRCKVDGKEEVVHLIAVFDGHGPKGELLSQQAAREVTFRAEELLAKHCGAKLSSCGMINAGNELAAQLDRSFKREHPEYKQAGSTATITLLIGDQGILHFSLGDSRTLLVGRDQDAIQLGAEMSLHPTRDWGVIKRGGYIDRKSSGCYRVNKYGPNLGRALGDRHREGSTGFPCMSKRVKTTWIPGPPDDDTTLVAVSDGVGDYAATQEIADALEAVGWDSITKQAALLTLAAKRGGSSDDITTVVVRRRADPV